MSQQRLMFSGCAGLIAVLLACIGAAQAQNFPARPLRIFTVEAGGALDITTRSIAQVMSLSLGQSILVENRPSGSRPEDTVIKAAPDGHTLLYWANPLWLAPFLREVTYDPLRDLAPISLTARAPSVLIIPSSLSVNSVRELVTMAKSRPGQLNTASTLAGTTPHLAAVMFSSMAGSNVVNVFYKGTVQGMNDLLAGRVQLMFPSIAAAMPHIKSGKLRALAVTSVTPTDLLPGIPALAASGYPDYEAVSFHAIFAPANTPAPIVQRLNQEVVRALHQADVKEKLFRIGIDVAGSTPEQLTATMKSEMTKLGKVIRDNAIRAE